MKMTYDFNSEIDTLEQYYGDLESDLDGLDLDDLAEYEEERESL